MADLRAGSRLVTAVVLVGLGLAEVQVALVGMRAHARLRDRAVDGARIALFRATPRIAAAADPGGPTGWAGACTEAIEGTGALEAELFDLAGHPLLAQPQAAPARHWIPPSDLEGLAGQRGSTAAFVSVDLRRVFAYGVFQAGSQGVILRVGLDATDVAQDLRERQVLLLGQGLALLLLVVIAFALLRSAPESGPGALGAYEVAMARMRDRGEAQQREHHAERERLHVQVQDKAAMARAGEITGGIVHEVRNGLGTILGYARLLERDGPAPVAEAAGQIRQECETLEVVVRRFVEFVRDSRLVPVTLDLDRLLSRVVARESRVPGAALAVPPPGAGTLVADEDLLERAVENLVRNAREAAGPQGRVQVDAGPHGPWLRIRVVDDGPGFDPSVAAGSVDPEGPLFVTTKPGGLGLGLPLVRKIAALHGGRLEVERVTPRGAAVSLLLPREPGVTEGSRDTSPEGDPPAPPGGESP